MKPSDYQKFYNCIDYYYNTTTSSSAIAWLYEILQVTEYADCIEDIMMCVANQVKDFWFWAKSRFSKIVKQAAQVSWDDNFLISISYVLDGSKPEQVLQSTITKNPTLCISEILNLKNYFNVLSFYEVKDPLIEEWFMISSNKFVEFYERWLYQHMDSSSRTISKAIIVKTIHAMYIIFKWLKINQSEEDSIEYFMSLTYREWWETSMPMIGYKEMIDTIIELQLLALSQEEKMRINMTRLESLKKWLFNWFRKFVSDHATWYDLQRIKRHHWNHIAYFDI